jgi:SAM-dependent methyltransferase
VSVHGRRTLYTDEARMYDIAFSWDTGAEVEWLLDRLGNDCAPVLEPACGAGRFLVAFGRRGIEAVGIDNSPAMVQLANERLQAAHLPGAAVLAEMKAFDLGRLFGGAFCPIDSLAYLPDRSQLVRHLDCVAKHLRPGSRYLVQLDLRDPDDPWRGVRPSVWESERDGIRVHTTWRVEEIDLDKRVELQRGRIECLSGPEAGCIVDEVHRMAAWTPERWAEAIRLTPFRYRAVYDGGEVDRPRRPVGTAGRLLWHELAFDGGPHHARPIFARTA